MLQVTPLPARRWTLDKHIPVAVIVTICLQTITAVWWTAKLESRVEILEVYVGSHAQDGDRLIRIEERLQYMSERMSDIAGKLQERRGR